MFNAMHHLTAEIDFGKLLLKGVHADAILKLVFYFVSKQGDQREKLVPRRKVSAYANVGFGSVHA
jgi:hypothetical protein